MSVAIPIPLLQNLPDVNVTPAVGVDKYALVYDHDTARFVLRAPFAGLLATGATTGATAQAQVFTNGVVSPFNAPAADSATAWQVRKADKTTPVVTVDTTNAMVGIGTATPLRCLDIVGTGSTNTSTIRVYNTEDNFDSKMSIQAMKARVDATVQENDHIFQLLAMGYNGTEYIDGANIRITVDDTPGATDSMPTRITFETRSVANTGGTYERMRIDKDGHIGIGTINPQTQFSLSRYVVQSWEASVGVIDTTISRKSAGVIQIGTTEANALGSLYQLSVQAGASGGVALRVSSGVVGGFDGDTSVIVRCTDANNDKWENAEYHAFRHKFFVDGAQKVTILSTGFVGINDTAPTEALDVTGNINTTGVVKVDDVQVLSNRVIDARCADAANSGDATTDGLIDALRDAMVAHGLIAAA